MALEMCNHAEMALCAAANRSEGEHHLKLYTFDAAPNPRRVNLFLGYKGIQIPSQQVNLRESQQFSAEYKAINPRCTVPALQLDDGTVLCDGIAICWYLESRFPQKPLLGSDPLSQAQVLSWDTYILSDAFLPVAEALRNRSDAFKDRAVPGPGRIAQIPQLEARGRQRVQLFWETLEQHLDGREYLVGDSITLADIDAFVVVDFAGWIKERVPENRPRVQAWYSRIKALLPAG
jgi:glutathione S-transferase